MKYALGVDVGGTNIRIAIVDENGQIIKVIKEKTNLNGINELVLQIISLYERILKDSNYHIEAMGIGVPGPCNNEGLISHLPNMNINESFNLKELIEEKLPIKVFVGNDANVAGLAEAKVGSGKGYDVVQYITLSTGIGGGLIINSKIVTGKYGFAQEVGAIVINKNGHFAHSKPNGCIEGEASGTALVTKAKEIGLEIEHAGQIFTLNDKKAIRLRKDFIEDVSILIANIVSYIEPDVFVLGGGLMKSSEYFLDDIINRVNDIVYPSLKNKIIIKKAEFDQDCGIIGAAMLAL